MKRLQPDENILSKILDKLEGLNFLSDERRALGLIKQYAHKEGPQKTNQRMSLVGLNKETISQAWEQFKETAPENLEVETAFEVLVKKFRTRDPKDQAKAYRFLMSRGFGRTAIQKSLKAVFKDFQEEDLDSGE